MCKPLDNIKEEFEAAKLGAKISLLKTKIERQKALQNVPRGSKRERVEYVARCCYEQLRRKRDVNK